MHWLKEKKKEEKNGLTESSIQAVSAEEAREKSGNKAQAALESNMQTATQRLGNVLPPDQKAKQERQTRKVRGQWKQNNPVGRPPKQKDEDTQRAAGAGLRGRKQNQCIE